MKEITAIIADDEPLGRERVRRLLARVEDIRLVGESPDGKDTVEMIRREQPDLVFLDVQMPKFNGFEVIEMIGVSQMPQTIFVTAFDAYAVQAFDKHALDYLVKPFSDERFFAAVDRARDRVRQTRLDEFRGELASLLNETSRKLAGAAGTESAELETHTGVIERFAVRTGGRVQLIRAESIDWIAAEGVYARLHSGKVSYVLRTPMHSLEARLDPRRFVRIHRSVIVNIDRVRELREEDRGEYQVILEDGTPLRLSRSRKANLERLFGSSL